MKWIVKSSSGEWLIMIDNILLKYMARLKKVQGKKKRDSAAKTAEETAQDRLPMIEASIQEDEEVAANLLSTRDEDVIF